MKLSPFNIVAVYGAGITWVYMMLTWIAVCVQVFVMLGVPHG